MKYQSIHFREVMEYCNNITVGKTGAGQYCVKSVKRFLKDLKKTKDEDFLYEFKSDAADMVIDFAESLKIPDIKTDDKKLKLLPWMKFIYYNLYGWVHKSDNERRRFRSGFIEVARKNSKTTSLLFPIVLWDFFTEDSAESYFVSQDDRQSYKTYQEIEQILKADNKSKKLNKTVHSITFNGGRISFFSSETSAIDGYRNSCTVLDEFHGYANDKIVTSSKYAARARKNGLVLIITSAGNNISGPCYAENEKARKILNGIMEDETYFTVIYAYDEKDDWKNSKNFIKANPSLGVILKEEVLLNDLQDAINTPSHQIDFKSKTCGIYQTGVSSWIPINIFEKCNSGSEIDFTSFKDIPCYGALDLSSINDYTVFTKCWLRDGLYYFQHRMYIPDDTINERYRKENIGIIDWIDKGYIKSITGKTIDYEIILNDIIEDSKKYNLIEIAYDRWNSFDLIKRIDEEIPKTVLIDYNQSLKNMSLPTKTYEKMIYERKIVENNPVLKWMIGNASIKPDPNGNYKIMKEYKSSTKRVDGVITSIMALDRTIANKDEVTRTDFNDILGLFK